MELRVRVLRDEQETEEGVGREQENEKVVAQVGRRGEERVAGAEEEHAEEDEGGTARLAPRRFSPRGPSWRREAADDRSRRIKAPHPPPPHFRFVLLLRSLLLTLAILILLILFLLLLAHPPSLYRTTRRPGRYRIGIIRNLWESAGLEDVSVAAAASERSPGPRPAFL